MVVVQLTMAGTIVTVLEVAYPFKVREASLVEVATKTEVIKIVAATREEAFTSVGLMATNLVSIEAVMEMVEAFFGNLMGLLVSFDFESLLRHHLVV